MNTKKELFEYIDSLNILPGSYTNAELVEVGLLHKALPRAEKNWKALCEKLGVTKKPETFRKFIGRQQLNSNSKPMQDLPKIISDPDTYAKEYKEQTLVRDAYNAYRLMLRKDARVDSFRDSIVDAIKNMPSIKLPVELNPNTSQSNVEAVLMLSDMHIGVNCSNFYNTYNFEVAKRRVAKLASDTAAYCRLAKVAKLNVVNLGDLIHGLIHSTARIAEEFDVVDQMTKAAELVALLLTDLSTLGIEITYRSCTDNHSRAVANYHDNIEEENFSRIIDWYLQARVNQPNIYFINDNIDASIGKFRLENGKLVMFAHGHLENINKCIDAFIGATKEFVDYVLLSHFHNGKEKSYNGSKLFVNGSIVGTEEYALSKRLFSPAEQKLLIFDRDNCMDININLQ